MTDHTAFAARSDRSTPTGPNATAVTVILPNYNHSQFLRDSLGSLFNQTRPADELIIFDDASTDDSVKVIESVISSIPNARLIRNSKNIGCVAIMNKGLAMARGDIILFAAADDVYYPRLFETGVALLNAHPKSALFSASSDIIDAAGANKGRFPSPKPLTAQGFLDTSTALRQMLRIDSWFMGNTVLYRRSALLANGSFDEDLGAFADGYMCRLLALKHGACFTPDVLAAWRRLEGGMAWSHAMNIDQVKNFIAAVETRMLATNGIFPAQYIHRWQRRYLFGGQRFALMHGKSARSGILGRVMRAFDALVISWLFLTLRPWDIGPGMQRRIQDFLDRRVVSSSSDSRTEATVNDPLPNESRSR